MRAAVSRVTESGHVVVVRLPDQARFLARYADDASMRDITGFVANLLLAGATDALEAASTGRPDPQDSVPAAELSYVEQQGPPGLVSPPASFTWAHLPSGEAGDFVPEEIMPLLARGIAVELTSAVAAEAADIPDTPADLLADPPSGPPGDRPQN